MKRELVVDTRPPHNLEEERNVLSGVFCLFSELPQDPESVDLVMRYTAKLEPGMFVSPAHGDIWSAIQRAVGDGFGLMRLIRELHSMGAYERIGGDAGLIASLSNPVGPGEVALASARIRARFGRARHISEIAQEIVEELETT